MNPKRSIAALRALCELKLHAEVLVPAVLEALHQVVPSHRNLFDWTDEHGRLVRYFIEGPIDARVAQLYFDEFHNRREAEAMPAFDTLQQQPHGVRGAAELEHEGFFRSALYNEIWRPQGFHTRLEAVVRGHRGQLIGSLVLYRAPGDARFSRDDERHLAAVLPHFAAAMQATGPAVADDRHVPSPDPPETLLLTLQGQICHASPGAHRLLLMADGGASRETLSRPLDLMAGRLVPMVLARLRELARSPGSGPHDWQPGYRASPALAPPPSITHETAAGQFVASGCLLRPLNAADAPLAQVTLHRLEPHRVALERALRALPITAGQMAVCRELCAGHTHTQIGQRLGVAPATVVDHVRKVYQALDVRSALELRAVVDRRIGTR
ncbi:MAG: LuxR C-terminal-related transcriptional regulator [Burkholderiaceae bacterium]|nr:LuxR C-terminal-related transcriptional regulator [Burkholderiaceae bacterium]